MSAPTEKDVLIHDIYNLGSMAAYAGIMKCSVQMVAARIDAIEFPRERVMVHTGFVADTLRVALLPMDVRFAYLVHGSVRAHQRRAGVPLGVTGPEPSSSSTTMVLQLRREDRG